MMFILEGRLAVWRPAGWPQSKLAVAVTQASDVSTVPLGGDSGGGERWVHLRRNLDIELMDL